MALDVAFLNYKVGFRSVVSHNGITFKVLNIFRTACPFSAQINTRVPGTLENGLAIRNTRKILKFISLYETTE